jgi:hypothetical protein
VATLVVTSGTYLCAIGKVEGAAVIGLLGTIVGYMIGNGHAAAEERAAARAVKPVD